MWLKLIEDHFVVSAFGGKPVIPNTIHKQFLYDIKLAGRKRIRFHDLRDTHATIMLEIGENSKVVSDRLGHSKSGLFSRKLFKSSRNKEHGPINVVILWSLTKKAMKNPIT
ncbi:hypothetical protein CMV16_05685 [Peribacillus simplex]|jgi:integrase|nr:hypothetical protein CMV16_05685 [Peribacillus simplex]